jgi:probable F420-dependent oxidoreductase
LKVGVVFPTVEMSNDVSLIRDYLQTVEGLGFSHVLMLDHVLGIDPGEAPLAGPYTYEHPFHEPLTFLAWAAGQTQRLELVTGILILAQRQTALAAKQATEIDILSGGRLRLGVGIGWNKPEYVGLGQDFGTRGKRFDAQIDLLHELWTQPLVNVSDRWHTIEASGINPRPERPIPIWIGGQSDAAMRRAARVGDGWMPHFLPDEETGELRSARRGGRVTDEDRKQGKQVIAKSAYDVGEAATDVLGRLARFRVDAGREDIPFDVHGGMSIANKPMESALQWTAKWEALGTDYFAVDTMYAGLAPAQHIEVLREFAARWFRK